jgi:hypothetical protein
MPPNPEKFVAGASPTDEKYSATLAYQIVETLNFYTDNRQLIELASLHPNPPPAAKERHWADRIQGWQPRVPTNRPEWEHQGSSYVIERCARIPYRVKQAGGGDADEAKGHFLDHILVGYAYSPTPGIVAGSDWLALPTNPPETTLLKLGEFLVKTLWPRTTTCRYVTGWSIAGGPDGYTVGNPPDKPWKFRGMEIWSDKTVRITVTDTNGNGCYLLVGYEGGGAW